MLLMDPAAQLRVAGLGELGAERPRAAPVVALAAGPALVAADIAGFLADGQDTHVVEATGYALNSLGAYVINEMGAVVYDRTINDFVKTHPLVRKRSGKRVMGTQY